MKLPWNRIAKHAWPVLRWVIYQGLGLFEKKPERPTPEQIAAELDEKARRERANTKTVVLPKFKRKP